MSRFASRHALRRTAAWVLLVWLVALAVPTVRACVRSTDAAHASAGMVHCMNGACAKFCTDQSAGVLAAQAAADAPDLVLLAPPPAQARAWQAAPVAHASAGALDAAGPPGPIPIPIAFLRLTL